MSDLNPDDYNCKRCGRVVRYAILPFRRMSAAFDSPPIEGGGFTLTEEVVDGVPTGKWLAAYTKVADRTPGAKGYRQHNCPGGRDE